MKTNWAKLCCVLALVFISVPAFTQTDKSKSSQTPVTKSHNYTQYDEYNKANDATIKKENREEYQYARKRVNTNSIDVKNRVSEKQREIIVVKVPVRKTVVVEQNDSIVIVDPVGKDELVFQNVFEEGQKSDTITMSIPHDEKIEKINTLPLSIFKQRVIY